MDSRINKRFEMDHMRKWLESGLPFSAHTSNGWYGQLERIERFKKRAIEATNEDDSLDFVLVFFQACYHLREWIPTFENIDGKTWNDLWSGFIGSNKCMKYCRDICNVSKHMSISKASVDKNVVIIRDFIEDESEYGKFTRWIIHIDGKEINVFELMEDCISGWKEFIKGDLFEHLALSKFISKD